ncbi:MAG: phage neck terminator protein [Vibrio sp.]
MTETDAQDAFRSALIPLLPEVGCRVIWADQNNSTNIPKPYYSLSVTPSMKIGGDEDGKVDVNGVMQIVGGRELHITIMRIGKKGDHPIQVLSGVRDKLSLKTFGWELQKAGISLAMSYQCQNTSRRISESETEPSGALECVIRYHSVITDNVGVIDKVHVVGDISGKNVDFIAMKKRG